MLSEKKKVALSSIVAAVFLTSIKFVVGVLTGSLGILSEAIHSLLDLGAAIITYFAVRVSDKPADDKHNYGHGKVESMAALVETLLLLVTCIWIIYEAAEKLFLGKSIDIVYPLWGVVIISVSIVVDISRSRALKKVAIKYNSPALEADALHFSSDVLSSFVVIIGLIFVSLSNKFDIHILMFADPIAALIVSAVVMHTCFELGKKTLEVLLDAAPKGMIQDILDEVKQIDGVLTVEAVRVRPSGSLYFIDVSIGLDKNSSYKEVHEVADKIKLRICEKIPNGNVMVSTYPVNLELEDKEVFVVVKKVIEKFKNCTNMHNMHIYDISGEKYVAIHLETRENIDLIKSHALSHKISELVQSERKDIKEVNVYFEYVKRDSVYARDITDSKKNLISQIELLINRQSNKMNCHDIKIYSYGEEDNMSVFLHCELRENYTTEEIQEISRKITREISGNFNKIESIYVHVEPMETVIESET